ncbi:4-hydroxy-2-oxovalerate aldolase [Francisellaceae bacterium CB300]
MSRKIIISDPTLRDGNHAIKHKITLANIEEYALNIDLAGIDIVEVGHGNGLGASSLQLGKSLYSDREMLKVARKHLKNTKLGIHIIPGFGCIDRDLRLGVDEGVDVVRVASHCTEADTTKNHILYARQAGCEVYGVLMMSHMASAHKLLEEALKMESYGAQGIVIMDSAGFYLMSDVKARIELLVKNLSIPVGFHGHNNMGLAVANSLVAVEAGASIIDGTICGFGAGAGNTPLEIIVAVLKRSKYDININLDKILDAAEAVSQTFVKEYPKVSPLSLVSGLTGVFSGFAKPVEKAANEFNVNSRDIFYELAKMKVVAGQEDLIIEVAKKLSTTETNKKTA